MGNPFACLGGMFGGAEAMAAATAALRLAEQRVYHNESLAISHLHERDINLPRLPRHAAPIETCAYCGTAFQPAGQSCGCGANRAKPRQAAPVTNNIFHTWPVGRW